MTCDDRYLEMHSADDIRVAGTRVGIEHLLEVYLAGRLPEEIALEFPSVTLEQVHGIIAWYLRNRAEVDGYLRESRRLARRRRAGQAEGNEPRIVRQLRTLAAERVTP